MCLCEWVKLAEWARVNRVHPQTAYRWFRQDRMPVPARRLPSGTIWVDIEVLTSMCARLYGRRGARNRAMRAVTAAKNAGGGMAA